MGRRCGRPGIGSGARGSARPQAGGFAIRAEAQKALGKQLARLAPGGRMTITLGELVDEYLELHQAERVTIAKLRLLQGSDGGVGETRLADRSLRDLHEWRLTIPKGHRFEAAQALRSPSTELVTNTRHEGETT